MAKYVKKSKDVITMDRISTLKLAMNYTIDCYVSAEADESKPDVEMTLWQVRDDVERACRRALWWVR
jgi:hypothetical protein